jgi:hypothetical protein
MALQEENVEVVDVIVWLTHLSCGGKELFGAGATIHCMLPMTLTSHGDHRVLFKPLPTTYYLLLRCRLVVCRNTLLLHQQNAASGEALPVPAVVLADRVGANLSVASTLDIMKQGNPRRISPRTNTRVQSAFNNLFAR